MTKHILSELHKILPQEHAWKMNLLQQWGTVLGPLSAKVLLQRIDTHSVVLSVSHPSLAQELLLLSDLIKDKINAIIGHEAITSIQFRTLHQQPQNKDSHAKTQRPHHRQPIPTQLTHAEIKHLSHINNKELQDALTAFYTTCKERTLYEKNKKNSLSLDHATSTGTQPRKD